MLEQRHKQNIRCQLITLTILTFIAFIFSIALVITLSLLAFTGILTAPPLSTATCTKQYYLNKYHNNYHHQLLTIFIPVALSISYQIILLILLFPPLINSQTPTYLRIISIYLISNLQVLSIMVSCSKIIMFHIDFNQMTDCSIIFTQSHLNTLLAISICFMLVSVVQFGVIIKTLNNMFHQQNLSQQRSIIYRQVNNTTIVTLTNQNHHHNNHHPSEPQLQSQLNNNDAKHKLTTRQYNKNIMSQSRQREPVSIVKQNINVEQDNYYGTNRYQSFMNVENMRQRERERQGQRQMGYSMRMERQRWRQLAKQQSQEFKMDSKSMSPHQSHQKFAQRNRFTKHSPKHEQKRSLYDQNINTSSLQHIFPSSNTRQSNFQKYIRKINSSNLFQQPNHQG